MKFKNFCNTYKHTFGAILLIIASLMLSIFIFSGAYKDLANAAQLSWQYFQSLFTIEDGVATVPPPTPPAITPPSGDSSLILPTSPEILLAKFKIWGLLFINGGTYSTFFTNLAIWLTKALTIGMMVLPAMLLLWKVIKEMYFKTNNKHNKDTLPLKMYKAFSSVTISPSTRYTKGLFQYLNTSKVEKAVLLIIWAFNLNIVSLVLPLIPFYFYFCMTFDFTALYELLKFEVLSLKYVAMLSPVVLVPAGLWIVDRWRNKVAITRLQNFEEYNEEKTAEIAIDTYKAGVVGSGKTMNLTMDALTLSVIFTKKAQELKEECQDMFPFFPWLMFEFELEKNVVNGKLVSWATCAKFIAELEVDYNNGKHDLYGYDTKKYPMNYYNGIVKNNLFKVLKNYAKLHFLYVLHSSFIISNYAIREDKVPMTVGNTLRWDFDFYNFDKDFEETSYYSKILNFDLLRMCRKIMEDNAENNSLEFGIICIAEADKEQMNAVETIADSPESPYPNPKNDGITKTEKFIRHRATIMGYCFVRILKDGQRVMSINADARELCTIEHIRKLSKEKNALPFFWIEKTGMYCANKIYKPFNSDITYYRGDNTLLHYTLKFWRKKVLDFYIKRKNRFGYRISTREVEEGTLDSERKVEKRYIPNAKALSDRYRTDSHAKHFEDKAIATGTGIVNYESYGSTTMSDQEFAKQNSYSRLSMTNPDWKKPYIDKANAEQEEKKAKAKAEAKAEAKAKAEAEKEEKKAKAKAEKEKNKNNKEVA